MSEKGIWILCLIGAFSVTRIVWLTLIAIIGLGSFAAVTTGLAIGNVVIFAGLSLLLLPALSRDSTPWQNMLATAIWVGFAFVLIAVYRSLFSGALLKSIRDIVDYVLCSVIAAGVASVVYPRVSQGKSPLATEVQPGAIDSPKK